MTSSTEDLENIASEVRTCLLCPLHESRTNAVPGEGPSNASVVMIGEAPGANEDQQGRPFVGSAGRNLDRLMSAAGLRRNDVFITNVVKCRPPGNRRPKRGEMDACHRYLRRQLHAIKPKFVVLLGDAAMKEFFPDSNLSSLHGKPTKRDGLTFVPMYHPAAMIYNRSLTATLERDFGKLGELLRSG